MKKTPIRVSKISKMILEILKEENKPVKVEYIATRLNMNVRRVRHGVKVLYDDHLIEKFPDLTDMRTYYYSVSNVYLETPIKNKSPA